MSKGCGNSIWLDTFSPNPDAKLRIFCFPYAGGSPAVFRNWPAMLPEEIELTAICYPGRDRRFSEPLCSDMSQFIEALYTDIQDALDIPYIFFGHSLGALISYELATRIQLTNSRPPNKLIVSAKRPPTLPLTSAAISSLPDNMLLAELKRLNGIPEEMLENDEIMAFFMPIIRADFRLNEQYQFGNHAPLSCPVDVWFGLQDSIPEAEMCKWLELTTGPTSTRAFKGDHFFINSDQDHAVAQLLASCKACSEIIL